MKQKTYDGDHYKQQGVALPIVMVILVLSALIVLYIANTSRKEQQISADQYRTEQSLNAAMAGLDWAIDYYNSTGLDREVEGETGFGVVDYLPGNPMQWCIGDSQSTTLPNGKKCSELGLGDLVVQSRAFFCDPDDAEFWSNKPETCDDAVIGAEKVGVVAMGYSDDNTARRVITVVLAGAPLLPPAGPGQPLTAKDGVDLSGGIKVINRYFNVNVMSGKSVTYSGTPQTYIGNPDDLGVGAERFDGDGTDPDAHRKKMTLSSKDDNSVPYTFNGSNVTRGNNADVLTHDSVLANLSTDNEEFFGYFLNPTKAEIESAAEGIGQRYETCDALNDDPTPPKGGVIWIAGDCDKVISYGSFEEPVAIFADGNIGLDANARIFGLVYAMGTLTANGGAIVKGSVIAEKEFLVSGAGTLDIVYDPVAVSPEAGMIGLRSIVAGTWKDWSN